MSEPLSKIFQLERKEAQPAPHKFINTHEDYCEGYNQCVIDLDQLSPDVEELAKIIFVNNTGDITEWNKMRAIQREQYRKVAQEIINSMPQWIKKG